MSSNTIPITERTLTVSRNQLERGSFAEGLEAFRLERPNLTVNLFW